MGCEYGMAIDAPAEIIVPELKRFILSPTEMEIRLRKGMEAEVKVLDDQGKPYAGAEVQARLLEGDGEGRGWEIKSQAYTGRDGVARLIGLDPEKRYRLGVYPDSDLRLDLDEKYVHDWEPTETTVQLEKK